MLIDCSGCPERRGERHCDGCIVDYILERPEGAVVFSVAEERALRALRDGGLLPNIKLDRDTG
jgi:hypothetical protein